MKLEPPVDFVIIAPLAEERDALLGKFEHIQFPPIEEDIRVYYGGHLPVCFSDGSSGTYQVIVTSLADMGLLDAGLAASDAIRRWKPRYLLLVGIAGGYGGKAALGDILIASQVADYEGQKVTEEGTRIRWSAHPVDQRLLLVANSFRGEMWRDHIAVKRLRKGMPAHRFGVIASGNKSVARADFLRVLKEMWDRLIGVEMEGAGAAKAAAQSATKPGFFMIRAVSDLADQNESSPAVARWRAYARDVAAAFTVGFLKSGPVPASPPVNEQLPADEPAPVFPNDRVRELTQALTEAETKLEHATIAGEPVAEIRAEILDLKRQLREGGLRQAGEILAGRYKLLEVIGEGGFAKVWRAYDRQRKKQVAVKMLHGQFAHDRSRRERFFQGARKMSELHHEAIVKVLEEKCEDEGFHFFVMDYWDGGNFHQAVIGRARDPEAVLRVIHTIGGALAHAHEKGMIHRDIKPWNILMDQRGRACLTDFDLVKAEDITGGTRTNAGMGTMAYAAPELMADAARANAAADVYGLAMTAVFALAGKALPWDIIRGADPFIESLPCDPPLKNVLKKATAWKPEDRYPSVAAFCEALANAAVSPTDPRITMPGSLDAAPPTPFDPGENWVYLAPGSFTMGDDESQYDGEKPAHRVEITEGFWLGRYPVTNREFKLFMEAGGYSNRTYWNDEGWSWLQLKGDSFDRWYSETQEKYKQYGWGGPKSYRPQSEPLFWRGEDFNQEDQPVVGINWLEASAFCKWKTETMGRDLATELNVTLPTEAQWEWAAKGKENRKYPWRSTPPNAKLANFKNNVGKTSKVGSYPKGATPEGIHDMAGNVWEWCQDYWSSDVYKGRPAGVRDPVREQGDADVRVLRGGSWFSDADYLRSAYRSRFHVWGRNNGIGFRCCLRVCRRPEPG